MTRNINSAKYIICIIVFCTGILFAGCSSDDDKKIEIPLSTDLISDYYLPQSMAAYHGENAAINGKGFQNEDILILKSASGGNIEMPISYIGTNYAKFIVPNDLKSGDYSVLVKRGEKMQLIGDFNLRIVLNVNVPDKDGASIKGIVYAGTTPLAGVRVSDGIVTTETDASGCYWLPSEKLHGYVFITIPSGYQPATGTNTAPGFWSTLAEPKTIVERFDFELKVVNNDKHTILVATDLHLANRGASSNNDMNQFNSGFMLDATQFANAQTNPLYSFVLGDMSWDLYWYDKKYDIASYKKTISAFPTPMYHVMGNHDNDPYVAGDFLSEVKFKKAFGPTYYSMNIGKIHYVFLDNNVFINTGGAAGVIGDRNFDAYIADAQLAWLKEDLAAVVDKSAPVVVSFHCPSMSNYNILLTPLSAFKTTAKTNEFHDCFTGFANVHFLNGHTHYNANMQVKSNIREHNVAAVCETWWWAGKLTDMNVCKDGSPSGYKVFEVDGTNVSWYYKGINQDRKKQFRTYDSNNVKEFYSRQDVIEVMKRIPGRSNDFTSVANNSIILNIWDYDESWTISVTENGTPCTPVRTPLRDPLHVFCYDYTRALTAGSTTSSFISARYNSHMFVVPTNSATGTLEITVTDGFGNTFTETMTRPKEFRTSME